MKYLFHGVTKLILSNAAVIFAIVLLPAFLVTDSVPVYDALMDYLFNQHS